MMVPFIPELPLPAWLRRSGRERAYRLVKLRTTRFRHLVRNYGRILDLLADAAVKQGGGYVLDRQYARSLHERVFDLAESMVFDLNVMSRRLHTHLYSALDTMKRETGDVLDAPVDDDAVETGRSSGPDRARRPTPARLAAALAEHEVLHRDEGYTAFPGVACGPVRILESEADAERVSDGAVVVLGAGFPESELVRVLPRAAALVTRHGEPAGEAAGLARDFNVPALVCVGDGAAALEEGMEITVDADENVIYRGCVKELLDYYEAEADVGGIDVELDRLRRLRRAMFPLTIVGCGTTPSTADCSTVHDLVHMVHEIAGEVLFMDALGRRGVRRAAKDLVDGSGEALLRVLDIGGGLEPGPGDREDVPVSALRCTALRDFIRVGLPGEGEPPLAVIQEVHALVVFRHEEGFDLLDAVQGGGRMSDYVYCRFAPGDRAGGCFRGRVAHEVLSRLDFASAMTPRSVSAWIGGLPVADIMGRIGIVVRLQAFLRHADGNGENASAAARAFLANLT